jgi:hypothetical protein
MAKMNFIYLYVSNDHALYFQMYNIVMAVSKRVHKGKSVTSEHLATCSSMKKLIASACKVVRQNEDYTPDKAERAEAVQMITDYILTDCVPFELKKMR